MDKLRLNNLDSTVKSSYRTLALFEFFAEHKKPATVATISNGLQIPQSSTSSILRSLVDVAYLIYDPDTRTYAPTMRMALLSNWALTANKNAARLPGQIHDLCQGVEETSVLAYRNGIYSQYLYVEHYDDSLERLVETGSVRPLVTSATGWCILKDVDDYEIGKIIRRSEVEITNHIYKKMIKDTMSHIVNTRRNGYSFSKGETAKDLAGIAMGLPDQSNVARLAIAVAGPINRIEDKKDLIVNRLKQLIGNFPETITREILEPGR